MPTNRASVRLSMVGLDDRVREGDVVTGEVLAGRRRCSRAPRALRPSSPAHTQGAEAKADELHVHVVGRAAHEAHCALRQPSQAGLPPHEGRRRERGKHVADVGRLAGLGIGDQAFVGELVLPIEQLGKACSSASCSRVRRRVGDQLPVDPHRALGTAQIVEELGSGPCRHVGIRSQKRTSRN